MSDTSQFRTVDAWKEALGLLPVRLRYDEENIDRYVLLNGSRGNFCLDFVGDVEPRSQRAVAWSCDVGHYITCAGDSISVNRWDRNSPEERFFRQECICSDSRVPPVSRKEYAGSIEEYCGSCAGCL